MTNRDLLEQAMPMSTLTRQEWSAIQEHAEYLERTEKDSKLCNAVKQLLVNQARLEVRSSYLDHFNETLDDDVREIKRPAFL